MFISLPLNFILLNYFFTLLIRGHFKDSIDFVFVVDIGVVVDDDEQDLDFVNKLDDLQIKTEKK